MGLSIVNKTFDIDKVINIAANPTQLVENMTYGLIDSKENGVSYISNFGEYTIYSNVSQPISFETTNTVTGELKITKLNTQQRIISGTFWYDAINPKGDIVKIREGRFDMHYAN